MISSRCKDCGRELEWGNAWPFKHLAAMELGVRRKDIKLIAFCDCGATYVELFAKEITR